MKLLLVNQSKDRMHRVWLAKWLKALSRQLVKNRLKNLSLSELVVVFVDPPEMRRLNLQYRGKDYPTDVLSFESGDPEVVGELVLCWPVISEQCKRSGLTQRGELGYMVTHGVLHLLGFDHERPRDQAKMFALQDTIYAALERTVGLR